MNIGICGGTFDPFHRGHIDPIVAVRDEMQWRRIIYIPAYRQPFKADVNTVSAYHRFAMAVLATESRDGMLVSPLELERGAISYTVDTLRSLRTYYGSEVTLDWIIGDDNLAELHKWKDIEGIFELANFVVLSRRELEVSAQFRHRVIPAQQRGRCGSIVFARNQTVPVSSTEIRQRLRAGQPVDELVDPRVSRYIEQNALYREVPT
jgi:nicotinate-nucleotide adenylyltransferase